MHSKAAKITISVSIAISIIVAMVIFSPWQSQNPHLQLSESKYDLTIPPGEIHESCMKILETEELKYSFESSGKVDFNIHYHEADSEAIYYPVQETLISYKSDTFQPEMTQHYCLMWENSSGVESGLSVRSRVLPAMATDTGKIPVTFRADTKNNQLNVLDAKNTTILSIEVNDPVLEFAINPSGTRLAVATAENNRLRVYDLETRRWIEELSFPSAPRFLVFSDDDKTLALADEHSDEIIFLDTDKFEIDTRLRIPEPPVAMLSSEVPGQLLIRTSKDVLDIDFEQRKIVQSNAKIPIDFGGEKVLIDPDEWCFTHGVPHPLYAAISQAMNIGLSGFISPVTPGSE